MLGCSTIYLIFNLVDLLLDLAQPIVEGSLHLGRIYATLFYDLGALDDISSLVRR